MKEFQRTLVLGMVVVVFFFFALGTYVIAVPFNEEEQNSHKVLFIQSYDKEMVWEANIEKGFRKAIGEQLENIDLFIEYMDAKRFPNEDYLKKISELINYKYKNVSIDLIIVANDAAYKYIINNYKIYYDNVPVIFCGISTFNASEVKHIEAITGITERMDIEGTIVSALKIMDTVDTILVVHDQTATDKSMSLELKNVMEHYEDTIEFEILDNVSMEEIKSIVSQLPNNYCVLWMNFLKDRDNHVYTIEESVKIITSHASVPVISLWDIPIYNGAMGGSVIDSVSHGSYVGTLAKRILQGENAKDIPVNTNSTSVLMYDYNTLKKFGYSINHLPKNAIIINQPMTIRYLYNNHRSELLVTVALACFALSTIAFLSIRLIKKGRYNQKILKMAYTDSLTGVDNRRKGIHSLEKLLEKFKEEKNIFTIAYIDINFLKKINDTFGHLEGDKLINVVCDNIKDSLRVGDILSRLGGDEFLIIFPNTRLNEAKEVADYFLTSIEEVNKQNFHPYTISISIGFQEVDEAYEVSRLLELADKAMYQDKVHKKRTK